MDERIAEMARDAERALAEVMDEDTGVRATTARLDDAEAARRFLLAGQAYVTLASRVTGARFTYRIAAPADERGNRAQVGARPCWKCRGAGHVTFGRNGRGVCFTCNGRGSIECEPGERRMLFVALLTGPENTRSYTYLGQVVSPDTAPAYVHGKRSRISVEAPGARAIGWYLGRLFQGNPTPDVEVWHNGRCGRCARMLTVPESIRSGLGPECASRLGGG